MLRKQGHYGTAGKTGDESSSRVPRLLRDMSLDDKIGQLSQIDILKLVQIDEENQVKVNVTALEYFIGEKGIGSVFNTFQPVPLSAEQHRRIAVAIQATAKQFGRPPVIWGLDSVHGANFLHGATLTPQALNLAASFNVTAAYEAGRLASRDTRAAGINWLFSPLLGIALEPKWSRVFETFGEDPLVVTMMAHAMIDGIQEVDKTENVRPSRAAACAKHFVGYSMPRDGHDRAPSWIPTRHLYQYFIRPWTNLTAYTVMESYTEYDGVPNVANRQSLNYLLRQRLGFEGMVVTDSEEMRNLHSWHRNTETDFDAIVTSFRHASVDMSMIPLNFTEYAEAIHWGVEQELLNIPRIDASVSRVLNLKEKLNMFEENIMDENSNLNLIGTDIAGVMDLVEQSIVLTKNDNSLLPLVTKESQSQNIYVTGPTANSLVYQTGSWTGQWQGAPNERDWFTYGETVLEGMTLEAVFNVSYSCGVNILGDSCQEQQTRDSQYNTIDNSHNYQESIDRAIAAAAGADIILVGVGEESSTEKPGDIRDLSLPEGQYELVRQLKSNHASAKIVLVYFGGRPRLLKDMVDHADAVIIGFLPGPSAGSAIAGIVTGRVNPSGRLPITYPKYPDGGGAPYFHSVSDLCNSGPGALPHWSYVPCEVQWPFGHGLSYTSFDYSNLTVSGGVDRDLAVSVTVRNTGPLAGAETVLVFTFDEFRSPTPEYKRLRAFKKIFLEPGESWTLNAKVPLEDLKFIGPNDDRHYILDPGMKGWAGVGAATDCRTDPSSSLCARIESAEPVNVYMGACEAACDVWMQSGCAPRYRLGDRQSCLSLCASAVSTHPFDLGNDGWGWNYVNCLESVAWNIQASSDVDQCWQMTSFCRDIDSGSGGPVQVAVRSAFVDASSRSVHSIASAVAFSIGVVSSLIIAFILRGGRRRTARPRAASETSQTAEDTVQLTESSLLTYQKNSAS